METQSCLTQMSRVTTIHQQLLGGREKKESKLEIIIVFKFPMCVLA